jgi:glycosyltransferase involved in cell wall biosynthesis
MIEFLGIRDDDISVVYPGISSHYRPVDGLGMREKVSEGKPYILFLGTVEPRKNLTTLMRAFAGLDEEVCLVISGHLGWGYEEVTGTIKELSLGDRVRFTGYTGEEDLPALYSGAELFVYPSWYEGFGLPPAEAMACGTPVASSTGGSLPEVLGDAALYFEPADVEDMRRVMNALLHDTTLRERLVKAGLQRVKKYTWRECAMEVIDVYRKFVQEIG